MKRMGTTLAVLLLATGSSSAAAQVNLPPEIADGLYATLAEVRENAARTFEMFAGTDGGPIPRSQFVSTELPADILPSANGSALLGRLFGRLDQNSDGQLSQSEWNQALEQDLQFADQNDDGRVTLKELANARENMSFGDALGMIL